MKRIISSSALFVFAASTCACAGEAACAKIEAAHRKTFEGADVMMTRKSGYDFSKDTPKLYGLGMQTCSHLRDETLNGEPVDVYGEQYKSSAGQTDETIWISKATGCILREEQDGDIVGKGKGHIAYTWAPAKP